jgi:peptide/nickel transport system substrate-binding protein
VQTVFGSFSPVATGPLNASTWGASAVIPASDFNPEDADALLTRAGWMDSNGDGVREKNGQPLRLKVVFPPWGLTPQAADVLELQWKKIGVAVDLIQVPSFSALFQAQAGGAYHLISFNNSGTDPYLLQSFYQTGAAYDWNGVSDARLDSLLLDAARAGSDADRLELYRQAQAEIASQYLVLPIRDYVNLNVAARRVQGLHFTAQGWFPDLIDVSLG